MLRKTFIIRSIIFILICLLPNLIFAEESQTLSFPEIPTNYNLLKNSSFESFSKGTSNSPDAWNNSNLKIERNKDNKKFGSYSAKINYKNSAGNLSQDVPEYDYFREKTLSFGCWIKATLPNQVRLSLSDGVSLVYSNYHTGSGAFEFLSLKTTLNSSSTRLRLAINIEQEGTIYIDGASLFELITDVTYLPNPQDELKMSSGLIYTDLNNQFVGIGISNPLQKLHISKGHVLIDNNYYYDVLDKEGSAVALFGLNSDNNTLINSKVGKNILFTQGLSTERLRIDASGNVGIGTILPSEKLEVAGNIKATGKVLSSNNELLSQISADSLYVNQTGDNISGNLSISGKLGLGTQTPEVKLHLLAPIGGSYQAILESQDTLGNYLNIKNASRAWGIGINSSAEFIIRDITGGNDDVFKIAPDAPANSLYLSSVGNLGIKTNSPQARLHIYSDAEEIARFSRSSLNHAVIRIDAGSGKSSALRFYEGENKAEFGWSGLDKRYYFSTPSTTNAMILADSGNIGMGTISPAYKLDVSGTVNATDVYKNGSPFNPSSQWLTQGNDIYYNGGNVGIGSEDPGHRLFVLDTTLAGETPTSNTVASFRTNGLGKDVSLQLSDNVSSVAYISMFSGDLYLSPAAAIGALMIKANGNVGIGTTEPVPNWAEFTPTLSEGVFLTLSGGNDKIPALNIWRRNDSIHAPYLNFLKSRQDTSAQNGDELGFISFGFLNSVNKHKNTTGIVGKVNNVEDGKEDTEINFQIINDGIDTTAMTLKDGNVGIGTTEPTTKLHINRSDGQPDQLRLGSNENFVSIGAFTGGAGRGHTIFDITSDAGYYKYSFRGGGTEYMTLTPNGLSVLVGNVGIGTTSPLAKLHIEGSTPFYVKGTSTFNFDDINGGWMGDFNTPGEDNPYGYVNFNYGGTRYGYILWNKGVFMLYGENGANIALMGGNVGIGTTNPAFKFQVIGNSGDQARIGDLTFNSTSDGSNSLLAGNNFGSNGNLLLGASGTSNQLWLFSNGNVGIGTTSPGTTNPTNKLHVAGNVEADGFTIKGVAVGTSSSSYWSDSDSNIYYNSGNVGIGTTSPGAPLTVYRTGLGTSEIRVTTDSASNYPMFTGYIGGTLIFRLEAESTGNTYLDVVRDLYLRPGGNVGIGLDGSSSPSAKLEVAGNIKATKFMGDGSELTNLPAASQWTTTTSGSNIYYKTGSVLIGTDTDSYSGKYQLYVKGNVKVSGNIAAKYQDFAEWVVSTQKLLPGTVVTLDAHSLNQVVASSAAYDYKVCGVVSENPGVILGEEAENKLKVAHSGRVKVKATAKFGAIEIGDLLVASSQEGVAMKSQPIDFAGAEIHRPGTILGKALEPLDEGEREILVLLSLQ